MKRWLLLLLCACPGAAQETPFDRAAMLANYKSAVAVPTYAALRDRTAELQAAVAAYCAGDAGAFGSAQQAWRSAYAAYQITEPAAFGPAVDTRLAFALDAYPVKTTAVDEYQKTVSTKAGVDELGTAGKGLPVIEYLLFRDDARATCSYLVPLTQHAAEKAAATYSAWLDYDLAGAAFSSQAAAVDAIVSQLTAAVHLVNENQLLKPLGRKNGGTPQPEMVAARFSRTSEATLAAFLDGVETAYHGGDDQGLIAFVRHADTRKSTTVAARVPAAVANVRAALASLTRPLAEAVITAPAEVEAIATALDELEQTLAVDVAGLLGVSLTFSDTDGD